MIGGIDECNKGEVLNPLIICCAYTEEKNYLNIPYIGESKNHGKKINLKEFLKKYNIKYCLFEWPVRYVDKYNLNLLLYLANVYLINKLKLKRAYIDSYVPKIKIASLVHRLKQKLPRDLKIVCENKLDGNNALTGIASLIAKKRKLINLTKLEHEVKTEVGSGNLNDKKTQDYIKKNYPNVINLRKTWPLNVININVNKVKKPFFI